MVVVRTRWCCVECALAAWLYAVCWCGSGPGRNLFYVRIRCWVRELSETGFYVYDTSDRTPPRDRPRRHAPRAGTDASHFEMPSAMGRRDGRARPTCDRDRIVMRPHTLRLRIVSSSPGMTDHFGPATAHHIVDAPRPHRLCCGHATRTCHQHQITWK